MALYVKLTEDEIKNFIAGYNLQLLDYKGIIDGVQNTNYYILTTTGKFILTVCEPEIDPADLPFFNSAMLYAAQHGTQCPVPLKNNKGEFTGTLKGKPAGIVTFLEGRAVKEVNLTNLKSLGKLLAQMHVQTKNFDMARPNPVSLKGVRELIERNKKIDEIAPALSKEIYTEMALVEAQSARFKNLPEGFIHADVFPDNVFFEGEHVSGVIDFYFSCTDYLAYDLAVTVNAWCFDNGGFDYNEEKIKALVGAYQEIRPLSQEEKQAFNTLLCRAALRFFATRAWDMNYPKPNAEVGVKNPMEYVAKLRAFKENKFKI